MKRSWLWLAVMICGLVFPVARTAETPFDAVMKVDAARLSAMMAGDGAALGKVFSEKIVFAHSDGRLESKTEYIKAMTSGGTAYTDAKTSEVKPLQVTPEIVVLFGRQTMRKKLGAEWSNLDLRFMSVWHNESGIWRMVAWQSLRPSGNSIVPAK